MLPMDDEKRASTEPGQNFFVSGGTLPPNSASYLERGADKYLLESLVAGRYCYVLNPRQLGKSSLSVHCIGRLRAAGIRTAFLDMTGFGGKNLTAEQWYTGLALELARELGYRKQALAYWKENAAVPPVHRLFRMIQDVLLTSEEGEEPAPLVIFIDEIDATRSLPFDPDEFYAAIRECFNRRVSVPAMEKLTFCLLGVAVPSDLIRTRAITPFNIGERIQLEDFTVSEMAGFARVLGSDGPSLVKRVHYWTGGHPFLSQSLCRSITLLTANGTTLRRDSDVDEIVERELFDVRSRDANINLADVANIVLYYESGEADPQRFRADILSAYQQVRAGKNVVDDESNRAVVVLKLSGIVRSDGRRLFVRNRIYEHVFDRAWIEEHMPEQEIRRQRQSYIRGARRTALVGGGVLLAFGAIAVYAWRSRMDAVGAQSQLAYELYVADINSLPLFYDRGDTGKMSAILNRHRNSPYRGFEWGYWFGRLHDAREEYTLDYAAPGKVEEGHVSTNGKEVCINDSLCYTASIVDRETKRLIVSVPTEPYHYLAPARSRWIIVRQPGTDGRRGLLTHDKELVVSDVKNGKVLSRLGDPNMQIYSALLREHSDFILTFEANPRAESPDTICLWNAISGKKVASLSNRWEGKGLTTFSADGRYLLTTHDAATGSVPGSVSGGGADGQPHGVAVGEVHVRDLVTGKDVDRFSIGSNSSLLTDDLNGDDLNGDDLRGRRIMYADGGRTYTRDIFAHRSTEWQTPTVADWLPGGWHVLKGLFEKNSLITLVDRGRCLVNDLSHQDSLSKEENVLRIEAGATDGEFVAGSDSVRFYDVGLPSSDRVIAKGRRLTRYAPGVLNAFQLGPSPIVRISENGYHEIGSNPNTGDGGSSMYSGRWTLVRGKSGVFDTLRSTEAPSSRIPLPFAPLMWSSGIEPDSIGLWHPRSNTLAAYSGRIGKVRWSRTMTGIKALWVSPDGRRMFVNRYPFRGLTVFDMANGVVLGTMPAHNTGPIYLTFSSDGRRLFTCGVDGRAVMWDTATLHRLMEFRENERENITSADLSPDGRRVVTTSATGSWQLWDASTGIQMLHVQASAEPLSSAIFSSDGTRIFTAGEDLKVREWTKVDADPTVYIPIDPKFLSTVNTGPSI
jgi:AAA domain-containing protein/WD40 domain-containing protein